MSNRKPFLVDLVCSVMKRGVPVVLAGLLLAFAAPVAHAGKVEDLSKILLEDSSYKVRVQAALVLGKLGDRNAVAALAKALSDENNTVRAVAAQALGRIGAPEAADHLKRALGREKDKFVRSQLERSLAGLGREGGEGNPKAHLYLEMGPFSGGSKSATSGVLEVLRTALQQKLGSLKGVTFSLSPEEKASFVKNGRMGFLIDGNVTQLDESMVGGAVEVNCDVKVMVARWPSKSIIMWTSAGAAVQGGSRPQDKESARRDCLEASAGQLGDDLKRFFQSQGG
ncbi:MAG: HEAT repeat domain-containing protein [Deltaproteobacteria bacterium]|nr:HEAT repeat domain-containing protein [Deltaproteobacteria bacterium]